MRYLITVQKLAASLDEYGGAQEAWEVGALVRAALGPIEQIETNGGAGAQDMVRIVFQTRLRAGMVTLADRVIWRGLPYAIKSITGGAALNDGLQLHCEGRL